jgi:3-oxoisoapionate decarboxylase
MKLGISSFTYGWAVGVEGNMPLQPMNEQDLIEQTLAFGLRCLQVGDNLPLHSLSKERLGVFKQIIDKQVIRVEIGARGMTENHLQTYLELAKFLNAPLVRFVIDSSGYEPDTKEIIRLINNALSFLRQNQIVLGIENHDRMKAKELAQIMETVGSNLVGICLDCVNSMGAGEGLEYVAEMLAPYTVNLHLKDFVVQRLPHKMGFTVVGAPAGTGLTNVPFLLEKIAPYKRCQSAILEQWVVPENGIEASIAKEKAWAAQGIAYLKHFSFD